MLLVDLTLPTPAENLALDEALLLAVERGEALRIWEAPAPMVVLGRSSQRSVEANLDACSAADAPVVRRVSGGAAVVAGPGCLMYAVTLDLARRPELADVGAAHREVLGRIVQALTPLEPSLCVAGTSDLAVNRDGVLRKVSGNSVRLSRTGLLYHGTLLYDFDLSLIGRLLDTPPRQPDYRARRPHGAFVANLSASRSAITRALAEAWRAAPGPLPSGVLHTAAELAETRYSDPAWNAAR